MPAWVPDMPAEHLRVREMIDGREMLIGPPVQAMRVGDVYDTRDGALIGSYPPERLARLARMMNARSAARRIPIDWNHATFDGGPPEQSGPLGFVAPGSATMRDGGLWVTPIWSARGEQVIRDAASLYLSVEFAVGADGGFAPAFDATTGARLGDEEIIAIALTPVPRVHGMQAVALSDARRPDMTGQEVRPMADPTAAPANGADVGALEQRIAELVAELDATRAQLATALGEAEQATAQLAEHRAGGDETARLSAAVAAHKTEAARLAAEVTASKAEAAQLAERLAAVEAARYSEQREGVLGDLVRSGAIVPARLDYYRRLYDAEHQAGAKGLFGEAAEVARANPAVQLGEVGHGGGGDAASAMAKLIAERARTLAAERGLSPYEAYQAARQEVTQ